MKKLTIPEPSLVLMVGAAGSGKSTFARKHFKATEVISSDFCRGLVSDDENDQSASVDAFELLHDIAARRLHRGRRTVIDATNVQKRARASLLALARQYRVPAVAIVLNIPVKTCIEQDRARKERRVGAEVIRKQSEDLRKSLGQMEEEGFERIYVLESPDGVASAGVARRRERARM